MMPDHDSIHTTYSRQYERDEEHQREINELEEKMNDIKYEARVILDDAIDLTQSYDTEDNKDLVNRLEKIGAMLIVLYDKMEG
jgi:hypothetical protein